MHSVKAFKIAISEWMEAIQSETNLTYPTFIFIDELDRCRPNYAVQMLEVIKHFFDIPNIIFVIATDTEQLQHAIKSIYGQGFEAQAYLGRFFNRRCTLNNVSKAFFIENYISNKADLVTSIQDQIWPNIRNEADLVCLMTQLCDIYDLSLRDIEQLLDKTFSIIRNTNDSVNLVFLFCLFMLYEQDKAIFNKVVEQRYVTKENRHAREKINSIKSIRDDHLLVFDILSDYVFPAKQSSNGNAISIPLYLVFDSVYETCTLEKPSIEQKRMSAVRNDSKKTRIFEQIYRNSDKIENYRDWVELAVSFEA